MITQTSHHLLEIDPVKVESVKLSTGDTVFTLRLGNPGTGLAIVAFHMTRDQAAQIAAQLWKEATKAEKVVPIVPRGQLPLPDQMIEIGACDAY